MGNMVALIVTVEDDKDWEVSVLMSSKENMDVPGYDLYSGKICFFVKGVSENNNQDIIDRLVHMDRVGTWLNEAVDLFSAHFLMDDIMIIRDGIYAVITCEYIGQRRDKNV